MSDSTSHEKPKSPVALPGIISAITPQVKNADRFSIFVDGVFCIGVSADTLLDSGLAKGMQLDAGLYEELVQTESVSKIKDWCLNMLARRMHSRKELYDKALRKEYSPAVINTILDKLEEKGWLDDEAFAEAFIRDKNRLNKWGPVKIKAELAKKGIKAGLADHLLRKETDKDDLREQCQILVKKRKNRFARETDLMKRKQKVVAYLQGKGYSLDTILSQIDELIHITES